MTQESRLLPCGVDLGTLITEVTEGEPPDNAEHRHSCPYCQSSLRALRTAWDDVDELRREPVATPPELTENIMRRVRALARHLAGSMLLADSRGETRISLFVIGQVARRAARIVPGVLFVSAHPRPHDPPEPARLTLIIHLVIAFGPAIDALVATVRAAIVAHVADLTGAELSAIDVIVEDIAEVSGEE